MKLNLKRIIIISLILAVLFLLAGLFLLLFSSTNENKTAITKQPADTISIAGKKNTPKQSLEETYKNVKFNSNEEIKREFGRVEIVTLFSGKEYAGFVLTVDDFYRMVTVGGYKKIPMKDVKCRTILE
ncbi:MAG: hypothetical protein V1874_07400 [Spirochaetota bacterium]